MSNLAEHTVFALVAAGGAVLVGAFVNKYAGVAMAASCACGVIVLAVTAYVFVRQCVLSDNEFRGGCQVSLSCCNVLRRIGLSRRNNYEAIVDVDLESGLHSANHSVQRNTISNAISPNVPGRR